MSYSIRTPMVLQGVAPATLQLWLGQAQQALQSLITGQQAVTISYANGSGNRAVTYNRTNSADLRAWIEDLQAALGHRSRRPIGVIFR